MKTRFLALSILSLLAIPQLAMAVKPVSGETKQHPKDAARRPAQSGEFSCTTYFYHELQLPDDQLAQTKLRATCDVTKPFSLMGSHDQFSGVIVCCTAL